MSQEETSKDLTIEPFEFTIKKDSEGITATVSGRPVDLLTGIVMAMEQREDVNEVLSHGVKVFNKYQINKTTK